MIDESGAGEDRHDETRAEPEEKRRTFVDDLAALAHARFADTQIGHHTEILNALAAFKTEIVELHERHLHA